MLRIFSYRVHWLIGVGLLVAISGYRMPDARAQDTSAVSVAELQQRVQDLEAVVRQMKEARGPNAAARSRRFRRDAGQRERQSVPSGRTERGSRQRRQRPGRRRQSDLDYGQEFLRLEQRLFPAVARSNVPVADHGPTPGRLSRIPRSRRLALHRQSSRGAAARPRAVRIRFSSAAHVLASRPRWRITTSFACCPISPEPRYPSRSPTPI